MMSCDMDNRLTYRDQNGRAQLHGADDYNIIDCLDPEETEAIMNAFEKLCKYEELEYEDRLLELPCSPGTTIYFPERDDNGNPVTSLTTDNKYQVALFTRCLGYDAFLTKEEAEKRLKELESEDAGD